MSYKSDAHHARVRASSADTRGPAIIVDTDDEQRRSNEDVPLVHGQHYGEMRRRRALVRLEDYRGTAYHGWWAR